MPGREILKIDNLSVAFRSGSDLRPAVKGVCLSLVSGEILGLVGESGSGKSTLARILLDLIPASSGSVLLDGADIAAMDAKERKRYRRDVQAVLQDPAGSLNPRKRVEQTIGEVIRLHGIAESRTDVREHVLEVLRQVGMTPPESFLERYPHELSGGQRQRVLIARAIALNPRIIVADEAVSALDASVKAGVLRVMADLKDRLGVGFVFITHDLPVVKKVADEVYVMRAGEIVEHGPKDRIFADPEHEYTRTLLAAAPVLDGAA